MWPFGCSAGHFLAPIAQNSPFWVRRIRSNGILSPPYPEVTLDNFSFLVGGRSAARRPVFRPPGRIFARKSVFCYRTPDFVNGPFVTLYETVDLAPLERFLNFSFPSYGPKWPKMAIFGDSPIASISTPNFGPISMKLGPVVRFTKKMTLYEFGPVSSPNYGETAVCPLGRKGNKWPKLRFSLYKHPQNGYSPLIIW